MSLDGKFNEESKNVLKTVTFFLQVGLQAVLSLTVKSNCVSGSSNFNTAFLPDCTKFCSIFSGYGIENLMEIVTARGFYRQFCPWLYFQTVFLTDQTLTSLFSLTVLDFAVFFMSLDGKFNEESKNVLKTVTFLLQVCFTGGFVLDCSFKLCFWQIKGWHHFSPWLYLISQCSFMSLDRKFNVDSKNVLKIVIFLLQVGFIWSMTVLNFGLFFRLFNREFRKGYLNSTFLEGHVTV